MSLMRRNQGIWNSSNTPGRSFQKARPMAGGYRRGEKMKRERKEAKSWTRRGDWLVVLIGTEPKIAEWSIDNA